MGIWLVILTITFLILTSIIILYMKKKSLEKLPDSSDPPNSVIANYSSEPHAEKYSSENKDLTQFTELILKNTLGNEITFKQPIFNISPQKKYKEVSFSKSNQIGGVIINTTLPFLQQTQTLSDIEKIAPNGLFTTVADPNTLSKFSDGSFTTMVRDSSGVLLEHKGFTEVTNLVKANPMIAITAGIQAMAAISGQYYLHQINSQLEAISEQVNKLVDYHNDEKIALLLTSRERLLVISSKKNVDTHDIDEIRFLLKDVRNVYAEYRTRLQRELVALGKFESKALFEKDKIANLIDKMTEVNFTINIIYEAEQLSMQAALAEIAVRMKLGDSPHLIEEQIDQLKAESENSFCIKIDDYIKNTYAPIVRDRYQRLGKKYLAKNRDKLREIHQLIKQPTLKLKDNNLGHLSKKLLLENSTQQEILFVPSENLDSQRVFVSVE